MNSTIVLLLDEKGEFQIFSQSRLLLENNAIGIGNRNEFILSKDLRNGILKFLSNDSKDKSSSPTKVSRKKIMENYGISKAKILSLEKASKLIPYYLDHYRRKPFYDINQIERLFTLEEKP